MLKNKKNEKLIQCLKCMCVCACVSVGTEYTSARNQYIYVLCNGCPDVEPAFACCAALAAPLVLVLAVPLPMLLVHDALNALAPWPSS